MTEEQFKAAIVDALGSYAASDENPDGGQGYYVESEARPWVVLLYEPFEFATPAEATAKAKQLRSLRRRGEVPLARC